MKDAYYFPHDSNAKDDPKTIVLIEELGPEGYGIFWILIEMLRDQPGYKANVRILPGIARRYNTTFDKVKSVVYNFGLFEIDDEHFFFSPSFSERMSYIDQKREKARLAGKKSGKKRQSLNERSTDAERTLNERSTDAEQGKESKEKESKEKESKADAPSFSDVESYFKSKGLSEYQANLEAEKFISYFEDRDWHDNKGKPVKSWKGRAATWIQRMKKNDDQQEQPKMPLYG